MDSLSSRKRQWFLTQEAFNNLLARLDVDRERAGEIYELIRRKLVKFFEWRGCHLPEDLVDETINRVTRRLEEGENLHDLQNYFYGVARLVFLEKLKEQKKVERALNQQPPPLIAPDDDNRGDLRLACFEACLQKLPTEHRDLIIKYYQQEKRAKIDNRRALADKMGVPLNTLRVRTHRIRENLEKCVNNCISR